jgi:hypothetical protein
VLSASAAIRRAALQVYRLALATHLFAMTYRLVGRRMAWRNITVGVDL